jgi:hypothetical protein
MFCPVFVFVRKFRPKTISSNRPHCADKSTDLDVPDEFVSTDDYRATLGHKACHSFRLKNAKFREFFHPRYVKLFTASGARFSIRPQVPNLQVLEFRTLLRHMFLCLRFSPTLLCNFQSTVICKQWLGWLVTCGLKRQCSP